MIYTVFYFHSETGKSLENSFSRPRAFVDPFAANLFRDVADQGGQLAQIHEKRPGNYSPTYISKISCRSKSRQYCKANPRTYSQYGSVRFP